MHDARKNQQSPRQYSILSSFPRGNWLLTAPDRTSAEAARQRYKPGMGRNENSSLRESPTSRPSWRAGKRLSFLPHLYEVIANAAAIPRGRAPVTLFTQRSASELSRCHTTPKP